MALGLFWSLVALAVFLTVLLFDSMGFGFFKRKNLFPVDGRTVVITGGSQGMGRGLGKLLAQKGANVVIVARDEKKLSEALEYIKSHAVNAQSQRFLSISADVTKPEENERILREVTAWNDNQSPDIVWANAGTSHPYLFIDTAIETLRSQMEINYWAAAYLLHTSLRSWFYPAHSTKTTAQDAVSPSNGTSILPKHFIMTSSTAAYCGVAGYAPYSPPKAALRSLCDTIRSELNLYAGASQHRPTSSASSAPSFPPVKIHCVTAGTIHSPGHDAEEKIKHPVTRVLEEGDPAQSEDEVAIAAVRELEKGGYLVSTQILGKAMRAGALGGSPRNGWGIIDTVFGWVVSVAWLFIGPDMEKKVWKWGKENGVQGVREKGGKVDGAG